MHIDVQAKSGCLLYAGKCGNCRSRPKSCTVLRVNSVDMHVEMFGRTSVFFSCLFPPPPFFFFTPLEYGDASCIGTGSHGYFSNPYSPLQGVNMRSISTLQCFAAFLCSTACISVQHGNKYYFIFLLDTIHLHLHYLCHDI